MTAKTARWLVLAFLMVSVLATLEPAPAQARSAVYVTSQQFDGGRMYYRADTGHIWVLYSSGQYANFPSSSYTNLPDNPFFNPPAGHIRPIFGFGKVWGGYTDVRNRLGWATTHELGFYMPIVSQGGLTYLTEIDGKIVQLNANGTWQYVTGISQPPTNATVQPPAAQTNFANAAYQKYERGFMIWRGDTGAVVVFWGDSGGPVVSFPENVYGVLPDNPLQTAPAGRVLSVMGFGKVWGNYAGVRNGLGYALGPEEAYTVTIQTSGAGVQSFRLPDGRWANVTGTNWTF